MPRGRTHGLVANERRGASAGRTFQPLHATRPCGGRARVYVHLDEASRSRGVSSAIAPPVLALVRRVEGLGAGRVVGDVDHRDDLGTVRPEQTFDALANCHLGEATALAPTVESNGRATIDEIDQDHVPTMGSDRGIHCVVEHPANAVDTPVSYTHLR